MPSLLVRDDRRRYTTTYRSRTDFPAACLPNHISATIVNVACYYRFRASEDQICPAAPLRPQIRLAHPYIVFTAGKRTANELLTTDPNSDGRADRCRA